MSRLRGRREALIALQRFSDREQAGKLVIFLRYHPAIP
jgi:hypothetical protein